MDAQTWNRAIELGVAEAEHPAIGGVEPIAAAVARRHDTDHWTLQNDPAHRAVELGCAEGEDAAVGTNEPIAVRSWCRWRRCRRRTDRKRRVARRCRVDVVAGISA